LGRMGKGKKFKAPSIFDRRKGKRDKEAALSKKNRKRKKRDEKSLPIEGKVKEEGREGTKRKKGKRPN